MRQQPLRIRHHPRMDFYILQLMVLDQDDTFLRGKLCGMGRNRRHAYFDKHLRVSLFYFKNNVQLGRLIEECLKRFFLDVEHSREPRAFLEQDCPANIIESIRLNALHQDAFPLPENLERYLKLKISADNAEKLRKEELQRLIDIAKENNCCKFISEDGTTGMFDKRGGFRVRSGEVL